MEEGVAEMSNLEWSSSRDGELGRGTSLRLEQLSVGRHRITLSAGKGPEVGVATITLTVRNRGGGGQRA
jgi:hypothetical protein